MRLCTHPPAVKTLPCFSLLLLLLLSASALPQEINVAVRKPVFASAPLYPGFPAAYITDGNRSTFTHPDTSPAENNFYYQIDLGASYGFDRLAFFNRADGCCTERLSNYRVQLFADSGGSPGAENWTAVIRADGPRH